MTTRLSAAVGPKIVEHVGCITTPGETIDAVITEAGVAVHPRREELADRLRAAGTDVVTIETLYSRALAQTTAIAPQAIRDCDPRIVGVVEYRDGTVIDVIRQVGS